MSSDSITGGQTSGSVRDDVGALRAEIAAAREEAEQELARLRDELEAVRDLEMPGRDVDAVTESIALQQELDTLRHALREKERIIDATAAQCRRLEDALEDQHLAYDGLQQDLERKHLSLASVREEVARLTTERTELEARYRASLQAGGAPDSRAEQGSGRPGQGGAGRLMVGVATGLVLGAGVMLLIPGPSSEEPAGLDGGPTGEVRAAQAVALPVAGTEPDPVEPAGAPPDDTGPGPMALGNVRDRLSDGTPGPLLVAVQGGGFVMGRRSTLPNDDEGPAHEVEVGGFLIGATEVTFEEYDRFVRATGGRFPSDFGWGRGRRPVVDVSWAEAQAYAVWLSRETGRRYRLPSEAEWEYAAAAGTRTAHWWGVKPWQGRAVCFDCGTLWDQRSTAPVGSFDPNPLGLYDTSGNAMEWVEDCYHPSYVGAPANGQPWVEPGCSFRVARGGAFNKPATSMRSTARQGFETATRLNMLGFRIARDE